MTLMKATVLPFTEDKEYFTEELCHIVELSNSSSDEDVSIARARVEPGVTTRWHRLKQTTERYYILSGEGEMEIGKPHSSGAAPQKVSPGDVVLIPPMCPQRIRNTGRKDLVFLAICSPRFLEENYENIKL